MSESRILRYAVASSADGFVVDAADRPAVTVQLQPTHFEVSWPSSATVLFDPFEEINETALEQRVQHRVSPLDYVRLTSVVAEGLMREWEPRRDGTWPGVREWAIGRTRRAIGKRVHQEWQRLSAKVSPDVLAVQRAVFAATHGSGGAAFCPELYRHPFIVSDILKYRAAAVACRNAAALYDKMVWRHMDDGAADMGYRIIGVERIPGHNSSEETVDALHNWRDLFSDTGQSYRSLNRTLMNLPGGVPHTVVCNLNRIHLERPVTDRLEFLLLTLHAGRRGRLGGGIHGEVVARAQRPQIVEALKRVASHTRNSLSHRRTAHIGFLLDYLADCPDEHNGSIVGLADKAIRWHRDQREAGIQEALKDLPRATPTSLPPIPMPDDPDIRFLATVGDIADEGLSMEHCVVSYARGAVNGEAYLFHIDLNGVSATGEVNRWGQVVQVRGPRNAMENAAVRYGKRVLHKWSLRLRTSCNNRQEDVAQVDVHGFDPFAEVA